MKKLPAACKRVQAPIQGCEADQEKKLTNVPRELCLTQTQRSSSRCVRGGSRKRPISVLNSSSHEAEVQ